MLERPQTASTALVPSKKSLVTTETIKPLKVVFFDTNVAPNDVEKTLIELERLRTAGYEVYGYSKNSEAPVIENHSEDSDSLTVLNPNAHYNIQKWHNIPLAIVKVDEFSTGLVKDFYDIFEAVIKTVPNLQKWIALEGFIIGNHKRLGNKFKSSSIHLIPFSSRLGRVAKVAGFSTSDTGREITSGGITLLCEEKGEKTIGDAMFAVDIKYHGQQFKTLSTALNQIDMTFISRIGMSLFAFKASGSTPAPALVAEEKLLLTSTSENDPEELDIIEELQEPVLEAQTSSRRFIYLALIATVITAVTALLTFLLAPVVLASIITTAIAVTIFTGAGIAEYFLRKNSDNQSQSVIEEIDVDEDSENSHVNKSESQAVLKQLRIARHNESKEAKEEDASLEASGQSTSQIGVVYEAPSVSRKPSI